jgi:tetratricopeptide (TPR) repeat protein
MVLLFSIILWLGFAMAKYTQQDVKMLASTMYNERDAGRPFSFLMGAGCSVTANMPAIPKLLEMIDGHTHGERVRESLKCASLKGQDYGAVMGCLTIDERKDILEPLLKGAKVNWGHIALAALMKANYIGRVLTFNFDSVLARAAGINGLYPATYDFGVSPADTFDHIVTPSILHLHGQGHGLAMLNSAEETEVHAQKLRPLFKDTFEKSNVLVIGYSGEGDKAFSHLKDVFANRKRLYWCNFEESSAKPHVAEILSKAKNTAKYYEGADFDNFLIDLATELNEFPPFLFSDTARHVLEDIEPIVVPPKNLPGAEGLLEELKSDLRIWQKTLKNKVGLKIRNAMLMRDWAAVIAFEDRVKTDADRGEIAWAYNMQGVTLANQARTENDEKLFRKSFKKYEAALFFKPSLHEALTNWGNALSNLAEQNEDEALFRQSFEKFEAALKIKPDQYEALEGWAATLGYLFAINGDNSLLSKMELLASQAEHFSKKPSYNLACAYSRQDRESECRAQLLKCKAAGTLPDSKHLADDADMKAYRDRDWFKELLAG